MRTHTLLYLYSTALILYAATDMHGFVSHAYSGYEAATVRKFLFWQQLFQSFHSIRHTQPEVLRISDGIAYN
jgi:hypothetical protein